MPRACCPILAPCALLAAGWLLLGDCSGTSGRPPQRTVSRQQAAPPETAAAACRPYPVALAWYPTAPAGDPRPLQRLPLPHELWWRDAGDGMPDAGGGMRDAGDGEPEVPPAGFPFWEPPIDDWEPKAPDADLRRLDELETVSVEPPARLPEVVEPELDEPAGDEPASAEPPRRLPELSEPQPAEPAGDEPMLDEPDSTSTQLPRRLELSEPEPAEPAWDAPVLDEPDSTSTQLPRRLELSEPQPAESVPDVSGLADPGLVAPAPAETQPAETQPAESEPAEPVSGAPESGQLGPAESEGAERGSGQAERSAAMRAVSERAGQLTEHAFSLADRGAYYSARTQWIQVLRLTAQALDAESGSRLHSQALAKGLRALEEADDFFPRGARLEADLDVEQIIAGHRTPVLKDESLEPVAPLAALQRYFTYAQQHLAQAVGSEPAASQALYGLGKLHLVLAEESSGRLNGPKALVFQQAALMVDAGNPWAANELGVLLARYGQWENARRVLLHSLSLRPQAAVWHNLSVVHEQLGEAELARRARSQWQQAEQQAGQAAAAAGPVGGPVRWVEPGQFARSQAHHDPLLPVPAAVPAAAPEVPQAPQARRPRGWRR